MAGEVAGEVAGCVIAKRVASSAKRMPSTGGTHPVADDIGIDPKVLLRAARGEGSRGVF